jgi:hypothetical protein
VTRLLEGPLPVARRERLAVVAGHLAGLAGGLAFDLRDEGKALAYFKVAVQAADDAARATWPRGHWQQAARCSVRTLGDLADEVDWTGYRQRSQTTITPPGRPSAPGRTRTRPSSTRWPLVAGAKHAGALPWCQVPSGSAQGTPPTS